MTTLTFKHDGLQARCVVSYSPNDASRFIEGLTNSDFRGYNPMSASADLNWIGRNDLAGQGITERRQVAERLGEYVENDHKQIRKSSNAIQSLIETIDLSGIKRMLKWNDSRGRVDAMRMLNGDSYFRRTVRKSKAPVEAIALVVPTGANCDISADVIFARTAVALAGAELLTDYGFTVEVWGYAFSRGCYHDRDYKNALACIRLKNADQRLNEVLASSGGSAWFFRSGIFGMWASQGDASCGLGSAVNLTGEQAEYLRECINIPDAHVMKHGSGARTVEQAIKDGIEDLKEALFKWTGGSA